MAYSPYRAARSRARAEYDPLDPTKQHEAVSAGSLVSRFVDGKVLAGASDASRALVTWHRVAGKRAAKHTVAVWLNQPKKGTGLPELVVYLDGNALMADLTTNAELFVERLSYAGLEVARVRFKLSRKAGQLRETGSASPDGTASVPAASSAAGSATRPRDLPALTPLEEARVRTECAQLPEKLRASASEAMKLSLRCQKAGGTGIGQTSSQNPR